jgi:hypothetical protein
MLGDDLKGVQLVQIQGVCEHTNSPANYKPNIIYSITNEAGMAAHLPGQGQSYTPRAGASPARTLYGRRNPLRIGYGLGLPLPWSSAALAPALVNVLLPIFLW